MARDSKDRIFCYLKVVKYIKDILLNCIYFVQNILLYNEIIILTLLHNIA